MNDLRYVAGGVLLAMLILTFFFVNILGTDWWLGAGLSAAVIWIGVILGIAVRDCISPTDDSEVRAPEQIAKAREESPLFQLNMDDATDRMYVDGLFQAYGITGNANIRVGRLQPVVNADRLPPLALRLRNAANFMTMTRHVGDELYTLMQNPGAEPHPAPVNLTSRDLVNAAGIIERIVEDRKASRSIYKGMTDDEMKAMAQSAVHHVLRTSPTAKATYDMLRLQLMVDEEQAREVFVCVALETLEMVFRVKASSMT